MGIDQISFYVTVAAFGLVLVSWFVFAGVFLTRKNPETTPDKANAPKSWAGFILQSLSYPIVWMLRRSPIFSPLVDGQYILNIVLQVFAVLIAIWSVWLVMSAIRELGKQWSLEARVLEDHKLIKSGVYQIIRHPIYTGMLGMLVATGLTFSNWMALVAGIIVMIVGTKIRTRLEEKLLHNAFGAEFDDWKARVPGLIPYVRI